MMALRYEAIIAREFEKINTPVTIRNKPVMMETRRMCFFTLLKW